MKVPALFTEIFESPIGMIEVRATSEGLKQVYLKQEISSENDRLPGNEFSALARAEIEQYFKGTLKQFSIPLDLSGASDFQLSVWNEVRHIAYGETESYSAIARKINNVRAVRAVGLANGRNPIPIIIPCHRVIGKNNQLTGYGFGLEKKRWLLEFEKAHSPKKAHLLF